jgi:hypothetical protein
VLPFHLLFFFFSKHFCELSIHTPTEMHVYERGLASVVLLP